MTINWVCQAPKKNKTKNSRKYVQVITSIVAKSDLSGNGTVDQVHKFGLNDSFINQTDLILQTKKLSPF